MGGKCERGKRSNRVEDVSKEVSMIRKHEINESEEVETGNRYRIDRRDRYRMHIGDR